MICTAGVQGPLAAAAPGRRANPPPVVKKQVQMAADAKPGDEEKDKSLCVSHCPPCLPSALL